MSQPPEDDRDLVSFLRHHRPNPPPAHPDLEDQIVEALPARKRRRWMVPSAIAASLVGAIVTYQVLQPQPSEAPDLAGLETYMESNWSTTINGVSDTSSEATSTDYLAFVESTE